MSFVDMIFFTARSNPAKLAIVLPDRMVTFGMLGTGIRAAAAKIRQLGIGKESTVAVNIESPTRHLVTVGALYHLGIVSVSITNEQDPTEAGVKIDAVITDTQHDTDKFGDAFVFDDSWLDPSSIQRKHDGEGFQSDDDLARIIMSSGTTARPKAIGMSARVVEDRILTGRRTLSCAPWDRMMCLPVLTSSLGFGSALQGLAYGHSVLIAESAVEALQIISAYRPDLLVANPRHLAAMVDAHRENPVPITSLRLIKYGGNALAPNLAREVRERFCKDILCVYSSTESGPIAYGHIDHILANPNTTGFIAPWIKVEVVDGQGQAVPNAVEGRIRVKSRWQGYDMALGPQSAQEWMYPGDLGKIMGNGMLEISGRAADAIKVEGGLVAPEQLEQALSGFPGIVDVAAVGMPRQDGTEEDIWLVVIARPAFDAEAVKSFLEQKNPLWQIARVHLTDRIKRNDMGKIVRARVKELARK